MTRPKPVLFLDVDGVLNVFSNDEADILKRRIELSGDRWPHPFHPTKYTLPFMRWAWKNFDVLWCTCWMEDANVIAKWAGLPERPCVATSKMGGSDFKLTGAKLFREKDKRPVLWIEDGLFKETDDWVAEQENFFYIHTSFRKGVTKKHALWAADILNLSMEGWDGRR